MRGGKRIGSGRPRGRKERISINIDPANLTWLKNQELSYSKIINRLLHESKGT